MATRSTTSPSALRKVSSASATATDFVRVYYGSATPEVFGEAVNVSNIGVPQEARTGFALAAGDFNGDGFADLAVASPGLNTNAGGIRIAYGGASGLADPGSVIDQDTPGVEDVREAHDLFGYSLAAGDFDGNGDDDLAVGVVNENQVGFVQVLFSTASGIDPALDLLLSQDAVAGTSELNDQFGFALAAADFDGDGKDDLAIGSPGEALGLSNEITNTGMVVVVYGSTSATLRSRAHPGLGSGRNPQRRHAPRSATASAPRSPPATSTPMATPISRSASRKRTSRA